MNPRPQLRRIARCLFALAVLLRGYSLLNAQILVTPEQKFEPGYLEAVATGYDHAPPPVPSRATSAAPEAEAMSQELMPAPAPLVVSRTQTAGHREAGLTKVRAERH